MAHILIVEDHAIVREPLARLLRMEGYQASCASNGSEALQILETRPIDLVIVDLMMPKKDGISLLEVVHDDARLSRVPILVLTGVFEGSQLERARALSGDHVMLKSRFSLDELLVRIRNQLAERERAA